MTTRRQFIAAGTTLLAGSGVPYGCSVGNDAYELAVSDTWRHTREPLPGPSELQRELVRYATRAPSSHGSMATSLTTLKPTLSM
jgi:hypothetical protein